MLHKLWATGVQIKLCIPHTSCMLHMKCIAYIFYCVIYLQHMYIYLSIDPPTKLAQYLLLSKLKHKMDTSCHGHTLTGLANWPLLLLQQWQRSSLTHCRLPLEAQYCLTHSMSTLAPLEQAVVGWVGALGVGWRCDMPFSVIHTFKQHIRAQLSFFGPAPSIFNLPVAWSSSLIKPLHNIWFSERKDK